MTFEERNAEMCYALMQGIKRGEKSVDISYNSTDRKHFRENYGGMIK